MDWEVKFVLIVVLISIIILPISALLSLEVFMYTSVIEVGDVAAYKSSCKDVNLNKPIDDLSRLSGHKVKFKGKFFEYIPGNLDKTLMLVKADNLTFYPYVAVSYPFKTYYNEGDELEIYGVYDTALKYNNNPMVPLLKRLTLKRHDSSIYINIYFSML